MRKLTEIEKLKIIDLYRNGKNCVQIKNELGLKGHQQVLNVITKLEDYVPYKYGRNKSRMYTLNESYFNNIDTEEKAYILGFLAADGHICEKTQRVKLLVATKDKDILEKIKYCLGNDSEVKDVVRETKFNYGKPLFYHSMITFNSAIMTKDLVNLGLVHNKTYTLNSSIINSISKDLIRHFLRGYFDGDGNVMYGNKYSSGVKYCINIAGNIEFLQNTFGKYFPTTNKYYKDLKSKQCWSYKVSSKERVVQFLQYIYKDARIYLDRKYSVYIKACGHLKQCELLETPVKDNQQPSLSSNTLEGSETSSQIQFTIYVKDGNGTKSALPMWVKYEDWKAHREFYNRLL